jgi:hypothetical protein
MTVVVDASIAAYLALARERGLPLATLDGKLAQAARREGVTLLGPLQAAHD